MGLWSCIARAVWLLRQAHAVGIGDRRKCPVRSRKCAGKPSSNPVKHFFSVVRFLRWVCVGEQVRVVDWMFPFRFPCKAEHVSLLRTTMTYWSFTVLCSDTEVFFCPRLVSLFPFSSLPMLSIIVICSTIKGNIRRNVCDGDHVNAIWPSSSQANVYCSMSAEIARSWK